MAEGAPRGVGEEAPERSGVGRVAANGTPIEHHGQRKIKFTGFARLT